MSFKSLKGICPGLVMIIDLMKKGGKSWVEKDIFSVLICTQDLLCKQLIEEYENIVSSLWQGLPLIILNDTLICSCCMSTKKLGISAETF